MDLGESKSTFNKTSRGWRCGDAFGTVCNLSFSSTLDFFQVWLYSKSDRICLVLARNLHEPFRKHRCNFMSQNRCRKKAQMAVIEFRSADSWGNEFSEVQEKTKRFLPKC